jgi:hypothetical protein
MAKTVYQGGASIDENGKAYGGQAGNQTGRELRKAAWYLHSKGWYILRAKESAVRKRLAEAMRRAVANQNIGYDQWQRNTLWNVARLVGYDPARVMSPVETDCSALVRVCMAYAGVVVDTAFRTTDQVKVTMATGAFELLTEDRYCKRPDYLMEGDILVTRTQGHTVIVLNDGDLAGSEGAQPAQPTYPTIRKGSKGAAVNAAQTLLLGWKASCLPRYGADAHFGSETDKAVRDFQRAHALVVDGIVGAKTWAALVKYDAARTATIKPGTWNVRRGAGTEHDAVGKYVHGGEEYPLVSEAANGWLQIEIDGETGWVSGKGAEAK